MEWDTNVQFKRIVMHLDPGPQLHEDLWLTVLDKPRKQICGVPSKHFLDGAQITKALMQAIFAIVRRDKDKFVSVQLMTLFILRSKCR